MPGTAWKVSIMLTSIMVSVHVTQVLRGISRSCFECMNILELLYKNASNENWMHKIPWDKPQFCHNLQVIGVHFVLSATTVQKGQRQVNSWTEGKILQAYYIFQCPIPMDSDSQFLWTQRISKDTVLKSQLFSTLMWWTLHVQRDTWVLVGPGTRLKLNVYERKKQQQQEHNKPKTKTLCFWKAFSMSVSFVLSW